MNRSARVMMMVAGVAFAASAFAGPVNQKAGQRGARPPVAPPGGTDGPGFSDNFDSYANGSTLVPQGGWLFWNGSGPPVSNISTVDNTLSASAPNSVSSLLETDNVQVFNITSGHWICRAKTYAPSSATGIGYFIMLNQFVYPNTTNVGNWSIQVNFDNSTHDQWVELVIDINLGTDSFTMTYGGQPLVSTLGQWSFNTSATQGSVAIQCIDLYSQMVGFRWDDVSLLPAATPPTCYPNCDGSTTTPCLNVLDFSCFLNKFASGDSYANCDHSTTVPILNVLDFGCFLNNFSAGCSSC